MVLYFLYKNLVMTFPHFFYAFYCCFSGISLYDSYYISFYNMLFTTFPLALRALIEFDVNTDIDGPIIESLIPDLYYLG
jgi:magnesium-transporting ATPase (P-type)